MEDSPEFDWEPTVSNSALEMNAREEIGGYSSSSSSALHKKMDERLSSSRPLQARIEAKKNPMAFVQRAVERVNFPQTASTSTSHVANFSASFSGSSSSGGSGSSNNVASHSASFNAHHVTLNFNNLNSNNNNHHHVVNGGSSHFANLASQSHTASFLPPAPPVAAHHQTHQPMPTSLFAKSMNQSASLPPAPSAAIPVMAVSSPVTTAATATHVASFSNNQEQSSSLPPPISSKLANFSANLPPVSSPSASSVSSNNARKKKVNEADAFGIRFRQLLDMYNATRKTPLDSSRKLMSLCCENLINFCNWARSSDAQTSFIHKLLLENEYLRPEVRNGIVMTLVYTLSALKASTTKEGDLFQTLQDPNIGLGISNKFSLRIYNDPFLYLTFLKYCVSGLIDAGVILDNERLNQPKGRVRIQHENKEELRAYHRLISILIYFLESDNTIAARQLIQIVTTCWQQRAKFIRNIRFVCAMNAVESEIGNTLPAIGDISAHCQSIAGNSLVDAPFASSAQPTAAIPLPPVVSPTQQHSHHLPSIVDQHHANALASSIFNHCDNNSNNQQQQQQQQQQHYEDYCSATSLGGSNSLSISDFAEFSFSDDEDDGFIAADTETDVDDYSTPSMAVSSSIPPQPSSTHNMMIPVPCMRFERVGPCLWRPVPSLVFDIRALLSLLANRTKEVYLVNESVIDSRLKAPPSNDGFMDDTGSGYDTLEGSSFSGSLAVELRTMRALITAWPSLEFNQMTYFLECWQREQTIQRRENPSLGSGTNMSPSSSNSSNGLIQYWRNSGGIIQRHPPRLQAGLGAIVYEQIINIGVLIRACPALEIYEDMWCLIYPQEIDNRRYSYQQQQQQRAAAAAAAAASSSGMQQFSYNNSNSNNNAFSPQMSPFQGGFVTAASSPFSSSSNSSSNCSPLFQQQQQLQQQQQQQQTFLNFLTELFPQFNRLERLHKSTTVDSVAQGGGGGGSLSNIIVKYCPQVFNVDDKDMLIVPNVSPRNAYHTVGHLLSPASWILSRSSEGIVIHDFVLEDCGYK